MPRSSPGECDQKSTRSIALVRSDVTARSLSDKLPACRTSRPLIKPPYNTEVTLLLKSRL
jgi:hypothetical protein